jgi:hypothetical protein
VAAAAGQQLQGMAHALAGQCIRCFMDHGHSFTAEQLGMFCKGLAQWGMRGTPQLAERLEQVRLGVTLGTGQPGHKSIAERAVLAVLLTERCMDAILPMIACLVRVRLLGQPFVLGCAQAVSSGGCIR